jgi:starch synthase (maltosyl-transferring)
MPALRSAREGPRIYNLFPLLAGAFPAWMPHLERACAMGFNWIFVNPVQQPGASGSIYSIRDYYAVNPVLADPAAGPGESQLRGAVAAAHRLGMRVMMDLVINHTAADSPLIAEHPAWYERDAAGSIVHPGAYDTQRRWVSWDDLAAVDNVRSCDRDALWQHWLDLMLHYAAMGFDGFRCDAAYQVPADLWRFLIETSRLRFPALEFFAETLGCTPEQTLVVAGAGFDYIFNSSKWWDMEAPWCLEQLAQTGPVVPSISFPESHDTERLAAELDGDRAAVRQRYVLAALFSAGIMIPIGFEYGFRRRLHVVNTRPIDWETPAWDDTEFIRQVNALKAGSAIWNEDAPWAIHPTGSPHVVAMTKSAADATQLGLLILNKDQKKEQSFEKFDLVAMFPIVQWGSPDRRLPPSGFAVLQTERVRARE